MILTKIAVTKAPKMAGPPKHQIRLGSTMAAEAAKLTIVAKPVFSKLMADTRPLILTGARE